MWFYLTGLLIVSSFVAISVTLAPKLLDSLVKETNSNTINKFKNPITLSLWSDSFLIKLNLQTKTPKYKIEKKKTPQRKTHSSAIKEQILLKKITFCAPPISGLWDINYEITKCYKFTDVQFKYFWLLTFNTIIIMWKMYSIWQFSLHLKSYTGEDAGPSVGERKTWRWA